MVLGSLIQYSNKFKIPNGTVVRQPTPDRHVCKIIRFQIDQWNNVNDFTLVSEFEVRQVEAGDRTELYNLMCIHGSNPI